MFERKFTKTVKLGNVLIGGGNPVSVQSMLNVPAHDIKGNAAQAAALEKAGCEIIRISVPDAESVKTLEAVKNAVNVPIVADIHFDWRLAVLSAEAGADKIRINPGNIGADEHVKAVADACRAKNIPIRIGVNSGSVEKGILEKYGAPTAEALVESGAYHISLLHKFDFDDIVLSLKSSDTKIMFDAYRLASERFDCPLHLGVTEAGTQRFGTLRSAAGIGGLLLSGIGDTIRVSLTDDPIKEVETGIDILKAVGLKKDGIRFVSCPTCGRTSIDLINIAKQAEIRFKNINKNITVAVMGCVVNGPGEAKEADIGIAGGKKCGVLFKNGKILKSNIPESKLLDALAEEIEKM